MDSYFNQLMEIQNSTDHSFFLLDQDSEPRFVIEADKRTIIIPAEFQFLGVKTDQRSEKIYFEVDRIFDDVDLSTKTCVIQYINAGTDDVDEGIYPVTELDTTTVPGKIVFKWEVDNIVCKYAGVVAFSVRFYEIDPETKLYTYCWNTIPESLPVLDGLNVSGSVTEDFPTELLEWNARMAALNTEITNKISAADATMKADLKTAKGYMDGAQAARGGAEEAESRVKKIVAGNEAYTKVESDTMYAKSQVKESERGTSVEISPEDGSNLAVTAYGFTQQAGSGDPSPSNVRAITNGGLRLVKVTFDGSDDEGWLVNSGSSVGNGGSKRFYASTSYTFANTSAYTTTVAYCNELRQATPSQTYSTGYDGCFSVQNQNVQIRLSGISEVGALKSALQQSPITLWVLPAETSQATGLYAPIILQGSEYRATCLPLTAPLCEGDSVVSWVKSGCDKMVTFSDRSNFSVNGSDGNYIYTSELNALAVNDANVATIFSNYLEANSAGNLWLGKQGVAINSTGKLTVTLPNGETPASYFPSHPLTVWYRSTSYTEAADIPVSLETHQQAALVLDGTEAGLTFEATGNQTEPVLQIPLSTINRTVVPKCSHYNPKNAGFPMPDNTLYYASTYFGNKIAIRDSSWDSLGDAKAYLAAQYAAGTPVTIVYELATPIAYAHPAVDIISNISESGKVVVSGQKEVSVSYHKSLDKTIIELDNKSYSKQYTNNVFARALRGTAEAAKSITIHPDAGSNVVVTIHGFTKQDGSGDASPTNVRALTNGGIRYGAIVYDGSSDESYTVNNKAFILSPKPDGISAITSTNSKTNLLCDKLPPKSPQQTWTGNQGVSQASESNRSVQICVTGITTTSGLREWLKQNPITVWYPLATGPLYASITRTGDGYTGAFAELTAPLCQGDTLITKVKSGCDKVVPLSSLSWVKTGSGTNTFSALISGVTQNQAYSDAYPFLPTVSTAQNCISVNNAGVFVTDLSCASVEDLQSKLAQSGAQLWYRSTNYTEASDIQVSLETHQRTVLVLDGTENWATWGIGLYRFVTSLKGTNTSNGKCSHMPYVYSFAGNGIFVDKDGNVAIGTGFIAAQGYQSASDWKAYLAAQYAAGTPVTIVYQLAAPITYVHEPVDFIASPDEDGTLVITGEADGTVSAEYNKDITYAFTELQSAILALGANLSL